MRNMTRLGGIARPVQSRSRRGYLNSAFPSTVTPRSSPPPDPASATTQTRASRRRLRTLWVPSTLIMVRLAASCRNHIGIARGAPSAWTVARIATSLLARKRWMRASPSVIDVAPLSTAGAILPCREPDALRLADARPFTVRGRRSRRHPRAGGAGLLRGDGGLRRHLADRAQLHGRECVLRSDSVRERGGRAHVPYPDRLRGDPAGAEAPDPPRHAAGAARQSLRRPAGHRCRARHQL